MGIVMTERVVTRREVTARNGMVTAKHPLVAEAGVKVLQEGGNAVDAAVAMAFATGVAEPLMSGLGGGGFMTVSMADGRRAVIDYQARAPLAAHDTMYELTPAFRMDGQGFVGVKDDANYSGHRSAAVPGLTSGLCLALEQFGTRKLAALVEPAIALAEEGYPVTWYTTYTLGQSMALLRRFPETVRVFLQNWGTRAVPQPLPDGGVAPETPLYDGIPYTPGVDAPTYFRQPDLALTLRRIAAEGPDGFYRGAVARAIAEEMERNGGHITEDDLRRYQAKVVEPVVGSYRGLEIIGVPPPASGSLLIGTLNILEGFDLRALRHNSVPALHLTIEAMRRTHADRLAYLGDPEFQDVPLEGLINKEYAAQRRATINLERHIPAEPGEPWAFQPGGRRERLAAAAEAGDGGCTTTLAAVDSAGNAVAITQTITSGFGCGVTVPSTGVLLNNAMTLFDPRPGTANSIQPGKRPASSMSHTIARRSRDPGSTAPDRRGFKRGNRTDSPMRMGVSGASASGGPSGGGWGTLGSPLQGEFVALCGAPGGRRILDTCTQVMLNVLDHGLGIQDAVSAALVDTSSPEVTAIDARIPEGARAQLAELGHRLAAKTPDFGPRAFASPAGISRDPATGLLHGGADPYAQGEAAGF